MVAPKAAAPYYSDMPDELYDRDVLAWSERQAELLRRLARGERVNDVDWEHVVEEIEDVGLSELNSVRSYLHQLLVHLLRVHGWPDSPSANHRRAEMGTFQKDAARRFAPSMRRRIDLFKLYNEAVGTLDGIQYDGRPPAAWPQTCPFTLDQLLQEKRAELEAHLQAVSAPPAG
jgi:hypothetical protein